MSRSGYSDDLDPRALNIWRGAVESAIRGARGQAPLREMLTVLDAMPEKRLIADELIKADGEVCALGAVARHRKLDVSGVEATDRDAVAELFNIAPALAAEIVFENDGDFCWPKCTPEKRFEYMHAWVSRRIRPEAP